MIYPIKLTKFSQKVQSRSDLYCRSGNLTFVNANLLFPLNKVFQYNAEWIYPPVVDLQLLLADYSVGNRDFESFENWLLEIQNGELITDDGYLVHNFHQPFYRIEGPWASGMAQGLLLSCLIRSSTNSSTRTRLIVDVLDTLCKPPLKIETTFGPFVEEFPSKKYSMVLNGFLFSLVGMLEFLLVSEKYDDIDDVKKLSLRSQALSYIETLVDTLPVFFSSSVNSYYDMQGRPADLSYHELHLEQLIAVNSLCEQVFEFSINHSAEHAFKQPTTNKMQGNVISLRKLKNFLFILKNSR